MSVPPSVPSIDSWTVTGSTQNNSKPGSAVTLAHAASPENHVAGSFRSTAQRVFMRQRTPIAAGKNRANLNCHAHGKSIAFLKYAYEKIGIG
jgi:hypothetical protein